MTDIKTILEGIVSQGKMVGSRGHAFRASSSSDASRTDKPGKHEHGLDIGAGRNYAHEKAAKDKAADRTRERETEVEKRNKEADQRKKEVSKMASEEHIEEAKGKWVQDKPLKAHVAAMEKRDTADLKGMHDRWSGDHKDKKSDPAHSERLLAVHHVLKKRGENVPDLPQHKNLGMMRRFTAEETNTEKRMKIKNVARPGDPEPTSEKSTLSKTGQIKTKIIDEEKPTMSVANFGLSASLIAAARQIVEKKNDDEKMTGGKTQVNIEPETNDKIEEGEPKKHTTPKTDKHKKLAALAHPKDKITHKDVLVGRGVINKEEMSSKEKMKRGLYRKEEVEQLALSAEEIERIEELAKSFQAEVDEAVKKSVPSATSTVSTPLRGANQDYSGVGTKGSVADYTISDSKKMNMKEEVELEEGSVELKPAEFHSVRTGKKSMEDLAKDKKADVGRVRGEYKTHADHWSRGEAHYNKLFKEDVEQIDFDSVAEEQLDELSDKKLRSYSKKAYKQLGKIGLGLARRAGKDPHGPRGFSDKDDNIVRKRAQGIQLINRKIKRKELDPAVIDEQGEQLDELKSSTLMSYKRKAQSDIADRNRKSREDAHSSPEDAAKNRSRSKFIKKADDKLKARGQYSHSDSLPPKPKMPPRAARRMMSDSYSAALDNGEVELDEVSDELKKSYVRAASKDATLANMAKRHSGSEAGRQTWANREMKRKAGLSMALKKEEVEELDELKKSTLGSYTKKAVADVAKRSDVLGQNLKLSMDPNSMDRYAKYYKKTQQRKGMIGKAVDRLTKEEVDLEEGRGRPRKNPLPPGKEPEGDDTHKHPMQQLEKISHSMEGNEPHFEHKDGSKSKITKHLAKHIVAIHNSMRTTQEKDSFAQKVHANRDSMRSEVSKHF